MITMAIQTGMATLSTKAKNGMRSMRILIKQVMILMLHIGNMGMGTTTTTTTQTEKSPIMRVNMMVKIGMECTQMMTSHTGSMTTA